MGLVVAFASQKGGTGKTTMATGFAVLGAQASTVRQRISVLLGDLDVGQLSAVAWGKRRAAMGHEPAIEVRPLVSEKAIAALRDTVNVLVLDLPGKADELTLKVARESDLMVVATDTNLFELEPTVGLLRALRDAGLTAPRVVVALSKVRDEKREAEAREYLTAAGFKPLRVALADYTSTHGIGNDGRSPIENPHPTVAKQASEFFRGLMTALERATDKTRGKGHDKDKAKEANSR